MISMHNPEEKILTPRIRFSGFTDAWEQRRLGEIYEKHDEKNSGEFREDKIISVAGMTYLSEIPKLGDGYLATYNVMRVGDIAFEGHSNNEFTYGRFVENTIGDGIVSHIFNVFRQKTEYDLLYWKYAINNEGMMRDILVRSTKASTMMHDLVSSDFLEQSIPVPSLPEQHKIGALLSRLDNLIALHQRKCDGLKTVKKSLLEKMFPREGETTPELRFSGFTDAWEQRRISDLFKITRGPIGFLTTDANLRTTNKRNIHSPSFRHNTKNEGLMGYYKEYLYQDAITWTTDGANAGTVNFRPGRFYCTNVCGVLLSGSVKADNNDS